MTRKGYPAPCKARGQYRMSKYELLYILPAQFADTEIDGLREKQAKMVEATGAKVTRNESLGKIKLAYPVKNQKHGTYVLVNFDAEPTVIAGLDRQFRLSDEVIRHMILELAPGQENKKFELIAYVAPLSDEAREVSPRRPIGSPTMPAAKPAVPSAVPARAEDAPTMSMEELDKKLDQILETDVAA